MRDVVVKINVGSLDTHRAVMQRCGYPTGTGIAGAIVLTPEDKLIHASRAARLAGAHHMGDDGSYNFFSKVVAERH